MLNTFNIPEGVKRVALGVSVAAAAFLTITVFLYAIGESMAFDDALPYLALYSLLGLMLICCGKVPFWHWSNLPHILTGLSWCLTFPGIYALTYHSTWFRDKIFIDFAVGAGLILMLTALNSLLLRGPVKKPAAALLTLVDFIFLIVPIMQIGYYIMIRHALSPASVMAIYLTNYQESIDFLQSTVGTGKLIIISILIVACLYGFYRMLLVYGDKLSRQRLTTIDQIALLVVAAASMAVSPGHLLTQTSIAGIYHDVENYVQQTQWYTNNYEQRFAEMKVNKDNALATKAPGTVIFVIGESASRDYMKAFSPEAKYDDTPWLSQNLDNDDFIVYKNVYAAWTQTVPTLQRVLTEQSQYNQKKFFESTSIIDVAKKAGYETYWFSNQGRYGQFDSAITLVARTADHAEWTDDAFDLSTKLDSELLDYLKTVNPNANNFIVLHLMGSHIYYQNRYPSEFGKWYDPKDSEAAEYANSLLYTDYILSQVFDYASKNLNLQAMVYFSDHGENLKISHNPDVFSYDMVHVPMFFYLSPSYKKALPDRYEAMRQHQNSYFTNDMLYDTVCGILNAPSDRYDKGQDFASMDYRFNKDNLTTLLGKKKISEDPSAK